MLHYAGIYAAMALLTGGIGIRSIVLGKAQTVPFSLILTLAVLTWSAAVLCVLIHALESDEDR